MRDPLTRMQITGKQPQTADAKAEGCKPYPAHKASKYLESLIKDGGNLVARTLSISIGAAGL